MFLSILKQLDQFQTSKSVNISKKNKKTGEAVHRKQMGSWCGGVLTSMMSVIMLVYFSSLMV